MARGAVFCLVLLCFAAETKAQCRHTLIAQKGLRVNTPEDIYVDFHECPDIVTIDAALSSLPNKDHIHDEVRIPNIPHAKKPVKITLQAKSGFIEHPEEARNPVLKAELAINYCFGQDCGDNWIRIPPVSVLINITHGYVLMTTQRPAYRPEETVLITLALTNQDLKPEAERRPLKIFVKTPEEKGRIIVHESAERFVDADGFYHHEYKIPATPIEGVWWAEAHVDGIKMAEKSFVIDRYELPTFQVKILPRYHFILETMTNIEGKVIAEYSYGEKVDGVYYMSFSLKRPDGSEEQFYKIPSSFNLQATMARGTETYRVPIERLRNILREGETIRGFADTDARIVITASVTGYTESVFESDVVEDIIFTLSPFDIDYSQSAKFFIPDTIYALRATIKDSQSHLKLPDIPVRIQWGPGRSKDIFSDKNGEIYHEIDSFGENVEEITITTSSGQFQAVEQSQSTFQVRKYIPTRTLGLRLRKQVAEVGDEQHVTFDIGNFQPTNIRFFVVARGQFVFADTKIIEAGQRREVSTSFTVEASMVPNARVIAYYIHNGELTSNSAWFDVTNRCETELVISSDEDTVKPGDGINIKLSGAPDAKVLVTAVDRAAYFVHNETRVNRQQLWSKMASYDTGCSRKGGLDATNVFEEAGLSFNSPLTKSKVYRNMYCQNSRKKRSAEPATGQVLLVSKLQGCERDGLRKDFRGLTCDQRANLITKGLTDKLYSSEYIDDCRRYFLMSCRSSRTTPSLGRAADAQEKANAVRVRKRENFKESWLFQLRELRNNGKDTIRAMAQDSITYYDIDAFGMSSHSPMCVAETKSIKVFTDVFIQLYLPYSLKVKEQATIRFSVFNYGDEDELVDIFIHHSEDLCSIFKFENAEDFKYLTSLSVDRKSVRSSTFTVLPLRKPDRPATIQLKAGRFDYISREILIEDEGQHNESSKTIVLESGQDGARSEKTITFDIPERSVMPTTKNCSLYAYAHRMGPSVEIDPFNQKLKNMDGYIRQPTGCGEQNMIRIGPIVYIHKYRVEVYEDQITAQQTEQVVTYIQTAYNIELNWRSDEKNDSAFAIWNTSPPSTWLNAFVIKVFAAGREFWPAMPTKPICDAFGWLLEMQNGEEGYFVENYNVHHNEMRGLVEDTLSLTAYVSISLVEAASTCPDMSSRLLESANRANNYLKAHKQDATGTPYTLAMGAYALAILEPNSAAAQDWNQLLRASISHDEEYIFWRGTRGRAADIETTAYGLLAELMLHGITPENDELTRSVAHWLISQRNAQGGFVSTQDTVVALQALSAYMAILETSETNAPPPTNLQLEIRSLNEEDFQPEIVQLTPENAMRRTEIDIDGQHLASVGGVTVGVSGVGTGSLAYRCTWRQYSDDEHCSFVVNVEVVHNDPSLSPEERILKVVVSKPVPPEAQMSIIDVGILSGFKPDLASINKLTDVVDASADRYEITENTVKFYLRNIDSDGVRLAFKIREVAAVGNRQPTSVSAYDYYEPNIRCTKFYTAEGGHRIQTINCEDENQEMCKCAEGSCPICRTRTQQLTDTVCSHHKNKGRNLCQRAKLCDKEDTDECYDLHRKSCDSGYLYVATVTEVGEDESGFKYFLAYVDEVIRESAHHQRANGSEVKFMLRQDCFASCKDDERLNEIARTNERQARHYISEGRTLMIYGSHPSLDKREDPPRYVYDLTEGGGMEITISSAKCNRFLTKRRNKNVTEKLNICKIKSVLKKAHEFGCD